MAPVEWRSQELQEQQASAAELELLQQPALQDLLRYARSNSPSLAASHEEWRAALEQVAQVGESPPPRLQLGQYVEEIETRTGPIQGRVGLQVPLGRWGESAAAEDVASQRAAVLLCEYERERIEVDASVREAWYELAWLALALEISRAHHGLLLHWENVALSRMESGAGPYSDLVRAQIELGKLEDQIATLADRRGPTQQKLEAVLGGQWTFEIEEEPGPLPGGRELPESQLLENLAVTSSELIALEARIEAAEREVDRSRTRSNPEFVVGAEYVFIGGARQAGTPGSGEDALALTVGLDLPFWRNSNQAAEREARAAVRAARHHHQDRLNQLSAELQMSLYTYRDANRRVRLFRESLIPKGQEALLSLESAYQAGERSFLDLVDAQQVLLDFKLEASRAEIDRAQALVQVERLSGRPLHEEI